MLLNQPTLAPKRLLTWRLWVQYDGSEFCGFQSQTSGCAVEDALKKSLEQVAQGAWANFCVAGRTDSGVHAHGQVVSLELESRFTSRKLPLALNSFLPGSIRVTRADEMPMGFSARFHSVGKHYRYQIHHKQSLSPFERNFAWHVRQPLDISAMSEASALLSGPNDYESFRSAACDAKNARRFLWKIEVSQKGDSIFIDYYGNAFCHNQIRIMTGTLVDVGLGRLSPADVKKILEARARQAASKTAPPRGLSLFEVFYPDDLSKSGLKGDEVFPRHPVTKESWPF